ncbi:CTP-dependent riboflavin kinase, partial [Candidatus Bathyarchaeota archaeon]|nr:CTP-dependent riboflavin kinase [Candidatus Bathyarchaeota archaeon]
LEKADYIQKTASFKGIDLQLTDKGLDELRRVHITLKAVMENAPSTITIAGVIFSGLEEGAYYVNQRVYKRQFKRKLGFIPYPGTLNLKLSPSEIIKKAELEIYPPILVKGFEGQKRMFGDVLCYPTTINDEVEGAAIMITRTHYDASIMEVIAPVHLRTWLNLKDGNKVTLKFFPPGRST